MVISLMTDFGEADEYVGVMKGVILAAAPQSHIVDLCHRIEPQNVVQAAFMIEAAFRHFPPNTLHVMVVDPGVGGKRRLLYAEAGGHRFICPDNGLLTRIDRTTGLTCVRQITNRALGKPHISGTFHGRDILAPVAGFLIQGGDPKQVGDGLARDKIVYLKGWEARRREDGCLRGRIVTADHFGNLITNIGVDLLTPLLSANPDRALRIDVGRQLTVHLCDAYEEALPGAVMALIGSRQTLELAINQASARDHLQVTSGCPLTVARPPGGCADD